MVSVTSEVLANASVQSASARSARPDPTPPAGNDSFASLIDSNASQSDNRTQANSQATVQDNSASQAPAPRRADDQQSADNRSRDTASASDNAPRNDQDDRDNAVSARDGADTSSKADAPHGKSKDTSKSSDTKSDDTKDASAKPAGGDTATTDQAKQDATATVTANAIAVTVAAPVAPAVSPATPATDKAAAPLAIAAAGIAASTALVNGTAPGATDAGTTAAAAANVTKADGTKADAQTAASAAATAEAATVDTSATSGIAAATASSAKLPTTAINAKPAKTNAAVKEVTAATSDNKADTSATATGDAAGTNPAGTAQTTAAKPIAGNGITDTVKGEVSGNAAHTANAAAHGHAATSDFNQALANSSGNDLLGAAAIQAQQPAAATTPAAATQLTATAATGDAVPLSGVAMEIAASAKSGKTSFEIRLDPADLGRIDVRIDVDRSGQVTSHLTVEKPETLSMLRQDAPQLQRALDDAGFKTDAGGLQFSLRDQSSSGQNSGNDSGRGNAQRMVISEDDGMPATAIAGRGYGRMLGSSSGVDIRV